MVDGLEKRKFLRLEHPLEVTVAIVSAQDMSKGLPQHIKSRNISRGGLCLETKSIELDGVNLLSGPPFARENRLHISIELIPGEPPLMATGEVRWYDIASDIPEFICRLGVAFTEMYVGDKYRLATFFKKHQKKGDIFNKLSHM
jgi:hypothetical protein